MKIGDKMEIKINYLGLTVVINENTKKISIIEDNINSKTLFNMVFKAILNKVNIDTNNYKIVREC